VHPRGFGFVTIPDEEDVFVPAHILAPAYLYADDLVRVSFYGDRRTASGVTLLKRTRTRVFATIARHGNLFKAVPDPWVGATPISLKTSAVTTANLHPGAGVLVDLSAQYTLTGYGPAARPRALRQRALERFSRAQLDTQVPVETVPDLPPRTDLTGLLTFTIDGPSSRDLDDAISVMCRGPNIALYVHIADVASAVPLGSLVDERARALATSIYLPGYSLPMFPPELSYDQCSLLPGLTRRCLTIEYVVSPDGEIVSTDLYHSLILSNTRLSYEEAARALDGTTLLASGLQVALELTHEATTALGCARARRGGLATERTEATYDLVVDGDSLSLASSDNAAVAHALIEEAMVAANEAVANWLRDRHLPGVFRTHPTPGPAASAAVEFFAKNLGITVDPDTELTPKVLALLETQLDELPEPTIPLWSVISPHLERAIYQPTPDTHFGLASSAYVHFTSPIRRYADLTVHRIITASLTGTSYDEDLTALCEHINKAAGYAARTEIAARALLWAAYLQSLPAGAKKSMKARIVKIADKGIVVALNEYGASGWILSRALDRGGIVADEHFHRTVGASGTTWALNDPITVAIDEIDTDSGIITFALVK
jgi:ribonuclease R